MAGRSRSSSSSTSSSSSDSSSSGSSSDSSTSSSVSSSSRSRSPPYRGGAARGSRDDSRDRRRRDASPAGRRRSRSPSSTRGRMSPRRRVSPNRNDRYRDRSRERDHVRDRSRDRGGREREREAQLKKTRSDKENDRASAEDNKREEKTSSENKTNRSPDRRRGGNDRDRGNRRSRERHNAPRARGRSPTPPQKTVFTTVQVGRLTRNVTRDHLAEIFGTFGTIKHVDMPNERYHSNFNRGYAYVEYENGDEANAAMKYMDGGQIDGAEIIVSIQHVTPRNRPDTYDRRGAGPISRSRSPRRRRLSGSR